MLAKLNLPKYQFASLPNEFIPLETKWEVKFDHMNGSTFSKDMTSLIDFKNSKDPLIRNFAGTVTYSATINSKDEIKLIKLSDVNEGVTELFINGEKIGMKWYGNHCYDVSKAIKKGENKIKIKLTTTLANYCASLKEDETAMFWTNFYETPVSAGLVGVEFSIK